MANKKSIKKGIYVQYVNTDFGVLIIGVYKNQVCLCDWQYRKARVHIDQRIKNEFKAEFIVENHPLIEETICQLNEYQKAKRKYFDLPVVFAGSDFQKQVWTELIGIPYGTTINYLELARKLKNEKAIRAVASANGGNALAIIVPCHRVIGSKGELTGYSGGLAVKEKLLQLEGTLVNNQLKLF